MNINEILNKQIDYINFQNQELFLLGLIFVLIFATIFYSLRKADLFKKEKRVTIIVSLIISFIGTYYLSQQQLIVIISSYNALGFIITFFIPFLIFLTILHKSEISFFARTMGWILFGIAIFYFQNKNNLNPQDFWLTISLVIILIAIIFDKSINKSINKPQRKRR